MKVYLISGKARHGKDTTASFMVDYYQTLGIKACVMHIGNYIKHFAKDYFGWDGREETKPRELLQQLGTNIIREEMNKPYFFTTRLLEDMEVLKHFYDVIIIADVRLPLEIEEVQKVYPEAITIQVKRVGFESALTENQKKHITETALDHYQDFDYQITNETLEQLQVAAIQIIKKEEAK